ncbi:MAG: hypothetical protein KDI51_05340 [Xanthomonadales bacterium]|nr:hypothetical protein [Xanthomonadales bacterium]
MNHDLGSQGMVRTAHDNFAIQPKDAPTALSADLGSEWTETVFSQELVSKLPVSNGIGASETAGKEFAGWAGATP